MANKKQSKVTAELIPDYDIVIVRELQEQERITEGGIIVPEMANDEENQVKSGIVISIGPNSNPNRPFLHKIGDQISFGFYNGRNVIFNTKNYTALRHLDVLFGVRYENEQ